MEAHVREFRAMGTNASAVVVCRSGQPPDEFLDAAQAHLALLESLWSRFVDSSDVSRINEGSGQPVYVDELTVAAISAARDAWFETQGRFDPTVGSAMVAAGYDRTFDEIGFDQHGGHRCGTPTPGARGVVVHHLASTVTVPVGTVLDLGGIGKGLAADSTVERLINAGALGAMVNLGGDLRAEGATPGDRGWTIKLACPGSSQQRRCRIKRGAVCTSSTTKRRWANADGTDERHHIVDPMTGHSTTTGLMTASVIAATAGACEVLATASLTFGEDAAQEFLTRHGATGLLIDRRGVVRELEGFASFQ